MTKVNVSYTDFSAGELSPKMYGRFDLQAFYRGHKRIENFIVQSVGQASYRNGFNFAAETAGNNPAFLWLFDFDDSLSFVLEFTEGKLRFFRNNGIVESGGSPVEVTTPYQEEELFQLKFAQNGVDLYITHPNYNPKKLTYTSATSWALTDHSPIRESFADSQRITNITQANPAVVTYAGNDNFTNGDRVRLSGISGMIELNDKTFEIANVNTGSNTFELVGVDSSGYTAYSSGGIIERIIESAAPFLTTDEYPSCVTFFEDRLIYGGSNNAPQTLYFSRSGDPDDFTLGDEPDDGIEYTVSGDGNTVKWLKGTNKFLAIGAFGDVLQATGGVDGVITPTSISIRPSNSYGVSNFNPIARNTQIFFMQRSSLVLRSFEFQFETDSYVPVDRNVIADHITSSGIKQICFQEGRPNVVWAVRNDGQMVGMTLEETEAVSGWHRQMTDGQFISAIATPRSAADDQLWVCVKRNINGTDKYYIEYLTDPVSFPQRSDYDTGDQEADNISFRNITFESQKDYIHVDSCLSYYGDLAGLNAGAGVTPAATTGSSITFTASASVFSSGDVGRQIWKKSLTGAETGRAEIVTYNSATEVVCDILEEFDSTDAIAAGDWYLTTDGVSGLDHLEGEEVTIAADGGQHPLRTVSSGEVTLERQCSVVHCGLGYSGYIVTNSLEGGGTNGTAQTKKKSVAAIAVRVLNSLFGEVGLDFYNLKPIYERTASMNMDRPPLPYTGDKKLDIINKVNDAYSGGWSRDVNVTIRQSNPFPMNVQLIIPYMNVSNV